MRVQEQQEQQEKPLAIEILGFNLDAKQKDKDLYGSFTVHFLIRYAYVRQMVGEFLEDYKSVFKYVLPQTVVSYAQANRPTIKSGKWSVGEIEVLRQTYPKLGANFCAQLLGRTVKSVERKASALGLRVGQKQSQVPLQSGSSSPQTSPTELSQPTSSPEAPKVQLPPEAKKLSPAAQELLAYLHSIAGPDGEVVLRIDQFIKGKNIGVIKCSKARDELVQAGFLVPLPSAKKRLPQKYKLQTPKKGLLHRLLS
jgi:hypothetical protein